MKAEFNAERLSDLNHPNISIGKPFIVVGVGDARGIGVVKAPQVNGTSLAVELGRGWMDVRRGSTFRYPMRAGLSKI